MRVAKKQNSTLGFKTPVSIVNDAFPGREANFIKVLSAINSCDITIAFYLENIKPL
jgi:hypothetical protein